MTLPPMARWARNALLWGMGYFALAQVTGVLVMPGDARAETKQAIEDIREEVRNTNDKMNEIGNEVRLLKWSHNEQAKQIDRMAGQMDAMTMIVYALDRRSARD